MTGANVTFFGAAGAVTGSRHLVEVVGKRILLDCGTFQGLPDVHSRNRSFAFAPDSIDAVIISHAHIDHCGMLPLLVKRGFSGPIYATPATRDLIQFMLTDAAGIETQDAEYRQHHHLGAPDDRVPLFTPEDVPAVMSQCVAVPYARNSHAWQEVVPGVQVKLYDAGHILGSAVTVLTWEGGSLAYTGDLGPQELPLLRQPEIPQEQVANLLLEATYGDRTHAPLAAAIEQLKQAIQTVCERGGKMIVPSFSLGRTQSIVYIIHKLTDEGAIPRFPIYVDSPLATDITDIYRAHQQDYDAETLQDFGVNHWPLAFRNLRYTRSVEESKQLNDMRGPAMIISASGMMTGGRVVHHLRHGISDPNNAIFVTGYQAHGTLGRQLVEGAKRVELYGEMFDVKAQLYIFNELSAHADGPQLAAWAGKLSGIKNVALVHSEPNQADGLRLRLEQAHPDWHVLRPSEGDTMELE